MSQRFGSLAAAALAIAAATMVWAAPAEADTPGFTVNVAQAPDTFTVGKDPRTVSAVVSTDRLRHCIGVRWALVISTQGVSLDQIRVGRVENGQPFAVRTQLLEDSVRVADVQLDPGQLCRGQTDTATWAISFTGPDNGGVTLTARASSANGRLLASADTSARVVTPVAAKPPRSATTPAAHADSPSPSDSPSPTFSPEPTRAEIAAPLPGATSGDPALAASTSGGLNVLLPGLGVGAVLVFAGVALLLRLRARNRRQAAGWAQETRTLPTGFYNLPRPRE